jgi:hypothetical protein
MSRRFSSLPIRSKKYEKRFFFVQHVHEIGKNGGTEEAENVLFLRFLLSCELLLFGMRGRSRDGCSALSVNYHPVSFAGIIIVRLSLSFSTLKSGKNNQSNPSGIPNQHRDTHELHEHSKACDGTNVSSSHPQAQHHTFFSSSLSFFFFAFTRM